MTSEVNGQIRVLVWVEDGDVKALVDDSGRVPVTIGEVTVTQDVNITASDIDVPVSIDAATINVPIDIQAASVTVPTQEQSPLTNIQARLYGWDLSNWRKLPMLWGYSSVVLQSVSAVATGAGTFVANAPVAAAGYVNVYTGYGIAHNTGVNRDMFVRVTSGASNYIAEVQASVASGRWVGKQVHIIVQPGDNLSLATTAVAPGDTIWLQAVGYRMKIDE
jgi:hypothetical protein